MPFFKSNDSSQREEAPSEAREEADLSAAQPPKESREKLGDLFTSVDLRQQAEASSEQEAFSSSSSDAPSSSSSAHWGKAGLIGLTMLASTARMGHFYDAQSVVDRYVADNTAIVQMREEGKAVPPQLSEAVKEEGTEAEKKSQEAQDELNAEGFAIAREKEQEAREAEQEAAMRAEAEEMRQGVEVRSLAQELPGQLADSGSVADEPAKELAASPADDAGQAQVSPPEDGESIPSDAVEEVGEDNASEALTDDPNLADAISDSPAGEAIDEAVGNDVAASEPPPEPGSDLGSLNASFASDSGLADAPAELDMGSMPAPEAAPEGGPGAGGLGGPGGA